jgi:hypothetical protein
VALTYTIVAHEPPSRVVLEGRRVVSPPDTITAEPVDGDGDGDGSTVHYDAPLSCSGIRRLFDRLMQLVFDHVGARATTGMQAALACFVDSPPTGAR